MSEPQRYVWDGTQEHYPANRPFVITDAQENWIHYRYLHNDVGSCRSRKDFEKHAQPSRDALGGEEPK